MSAGDPGYGAFPQPPPAGYPQFLSLPRRRRPRYWLHALLLLLTLLTTTAMGARLAYNFERNLPAFGETDLAAVGRLLLDPASLASGLPFSLTLLTILMAHEMGHYLACVYYRIDASLPYFIPAPTLIGTFGAFIRIRSPIYSRRELFDVGIAGPLAGFLVLIPAFAIGMAYGKVLPEIATRGDLVFGVPWIERLLQMAIFPGVAASDIYLHPMARAAWVGVLATALNLLPIGQLDGGHIVYSFIGERSRLLSRLLVALMVPLGLFVSWSWLVWAVLLTVFALRHPHIEDHRSVGRGRLWLGILSAAILVLSFTPIPVDIP